MKAGNGERLLQRAKKRFKEWRKKKAGGERIPEELWKIAIDLSKYYAPGYIGNHLSLSFCDLKKRIQLREQNHSGSVPTQRFIELPIIHPDPFKERMIEWENPKGYKIRLGYGEAEANKIKDYLGWVFCGGQP